jgi:uncharacterized membrane protein (UPF0127 family)
MDARIGRIAVLLSLLCSLGCGPKASDVSDLKTKTVTLPNGKEITAEVVISQTEMLRGLMFRDKLPPDRGMLFIHGSPGPYAYWMYNVRIPLDIIWLDEDRRIVEISPNTPPCPSKSAKECPSYGGKVPARFVLELAGGTAQKEGLRLGDRVSF